MLVGPDRTPSSQWTWAALCVTPATARTAFGGAHYSRGDLTQAVGASVPWPSAARCLL